MTSWSLTASGIGKRRCFSYQRHGHHLQLFVALAFSQMFNLLCERADNVHGGRLPHHVRVLWDEAPTRAGAQAGKAGGCHPLP